MKTYNGFARYVRIEDWSMRGEWSIMFSAEDHQLRSATVPTLGQAEGAAIDFIRECPIGYALIVVARHVGQCEWSGDWMIAYNGRVIEYGSAENVIRAESDACRWMLDHRPEAGACSPD